MSHIPDFRSYENYKLLNDADRAYLDGYRDAIESAKEALAGFHDELEDALSLLNAMGKINPVYRCYGAQDLFDSFCEYMDAREIEAVCSTFENAAYIPTDVELKDVSSRVYYKAMKGSEAE